MQDRPISVINNLRTSRFSVFAAIRAEIASQGPEYQQGRTKNLPDEIKDR